MKVTSTDAFSPLIEALPIMNFLISVSCASYSGSPSSAPTSPLEVVESFQIRSAVPW